MDKRTKQKVKDLLDTELAGTITITIKELHQVMYLIGSVRTKIHSDDINMLMPIDIWESLQHFYKFHSPKVKRLAFKLLKLKTSTKAKTNKRKVNRV